MTWHASSRGDVVTSNLILPSEAVPHYFQPAPRPDPGQVTTVLVTRYWVGATPRPGSYWRRRAALFLNWCLPSVTAQRHPPDAWLILADPAAWALIGQPVLDQIRALPYAHLVDVPPRRAFGSLARAWVARAREDGTLPERRWLLAARVDNDDALAVDYLDAMVKWVARAQPETVCTLVYPHGLQYETNLGQAVLDINGTNHFTAVLHGAQDPYVGPFGPGHQEIYREASRWPHSSAGIHQLTTRYPMWIEVLHEDNAANQMRWGPWAGVDERYLQERFGLVPHLSFPGVSASEVI